MNSIPDIGLHTPEQTAALQQATGMLVTIGRNGARLVQPSAFKCLLESDAQPERDHTAKDAA